MLYDITGWNLNLLKVGAQIVSELSRMPARSIGRRDKIPCTAIGQWWRKMKESPRDDWVIMTAHQRKQVRRRQRRKDNLLFLFCKVTKIQSVFVQEPLWAHLQSCPRLTISKTRSKTVTCQIQTTCLKQKIWRQLVSIGSFKTFGCY